MQPIKIKKKPTVQYMYVIIDERGMYLSSSNETGTWWADLPMDAKMIRNYELAEKFIKDQKIRFVEIQKITLDPQPIKTS